MQPLALTAAVMAAGLAAITAADLGTFAATGATIMSVGLTAIAVASPAFAAADPDLTAHSVTARDQGNCAFGFLTDTVYVNVDGQDYTVSINCNFYNSQTLHLGENDECDVTSGACSDFSPQQQIVINCYQGGYTSTAIACPTT